MSQTLEDVGHTLAVTEALYRCAAAIDTFDLDAFVSCFAPDGAFRSIAPDGSVSEVSGSSDLRELLDGWRAVPTGSWRHQVTSTRVELSDGAAKAVAHSYWSSLDSGGADGAPRVVAFGTYMDTFVRSGEQWLLESRTVNLDGAS